LKNRNTMIGTIPSTLQPCLDKACITRFVLWTIQYYPLCKENVYLSIVLSFQYDNLRKKDSIYIKTKESLNYFLVGQTSYCIRDLVIIKVRFLHFHPQQREEDKYSCPCLHQIHMDWYPWLVINNNNFICI